MIEDFLRLRNEINKSKFRFSMTSALWAAHYVSDEEVSADNVVKVVRDGVLEGYAVFTLICHERIKSCRIMEICARSREVLANLIDQIIDRSMKEGVDFIFLRKDDEPLDVVFDQRKFVSLVDHVITSVLLDPYKLLLSMSKNSEGGKVLELAIKGFAPIFVQVGRQYIKIVDQEKPSLTIKTDSETFLELFFGKTSFMKEFLKRKATVDTIFNLSTAVHFFDIIKQEKAYIPNGDWT